MHVGPDKLENTRTRILLFFAGLCLVFMGILVSFVYWPSPMETACRDVPEGTVVIALAYKHSGEDPLTGKILPGKANERIAEKLEECAGRFRIVLTQKAVSDALANEHELKNGVSVMQMHKDNEVNVRTLEALFCAVERLREYPDNLPIGLMAHDKHFRRSRQALEAVLQDMKPGARVVDIHLGETPYQDDAFYRPWLWALRELVSVPWQYLQIKMGSFRCSDPVSTPDALPLGAKQ